MKGNLIKRFKIFHSDRGGEFSKNDFLDHLPNCGVIHQVSRPRTREQNSVAERKHRHVDELGLVKMYHAIG